MNYEKAWKQLEKIVEEKYKEANKAYVDSVYNNDDPSRVDPKRARKHELDLILITMGALKTECNIG